MRLRRALAAAAFLALAALAWATSGAGSAPGPGATAAAEEEAATPRGKDLYEANCASCHKKDGSGGVKVMATGEPTRSFRTREFWKGRSDGRLYQAIEAGVPKTGMVPWKGVLKPQQIRDVVDYMRSAFQPGEPRPDRKAAVEEPGAR